MKVRGAGEGPQVILGAVGSCAGEVRVCMEFSGTAEDWGIPKSPSEALSNKVNKASSLDWNHRETGLPEQHLWPSRGQGDS